MEGFMVEVAVGWGAENGFVFLLIAFIFKLKNSQVDIV